MADRSSWLSPRAAGNILVAALARSLFTGLALAVLVLVAVLCGTPGAVATDPTISDREWFLEKVAMHEAAIFTESKIHVFRLRPNEDLLDSIFRYARATGIEAAMILTCVGSLVQTNIRYANEPNGTVLTGHFEIISLVGTIDFQSPADPEGSGHVHIGCSDSQGQTVGGHLLSGNLIYTTAEISLLSLPNGLFRRKLDVHGSGYDELKIYYRDLEGVIP
jgi:predicted DNA-binding protein with PD1-like motif